MDTTSLPIAPPLPLSAATVDGRTLRELLSVTREELEARLNSDTLVAAARDNGKKFASWMASTHWPQLTGQVADHLLGFLEENVVTVFAGAWSKYAELRKAAQETLELSLCESAINRVSSGKCRCSDQISCADFPPVWERPLAGVDLPGEMRLTHPIAIVH